MTALLFIVFMDRVQQRKHIVICMLSNASN